MCTCMHCRVGVKCASLFLGGYGTIFNNNAEKTEVLQKLFCSVFEEKPRYVVI